MGKINPGGLKAGLSNIKYDDIFPLNNADIEPTANGISIDIIRALLFRIFIYWYAY